MPDELAVEADELETNAAALRGEILTLGLSLVARTATEKTARKVGVRFVRR